MCTICGNQSHEVAGSGIYSACKIGNAIDVHKWSLASLGPKVEPPEKLHCTVCYSTKPFDVTKVPDFKPIKMGKNEGRRIGRLGTMIVLFLEEEESRPLHDIWKAFIDQGASFDFPSYIPHISIAEESELTDADLTEVKPYSGPILFLPPYIDQLKDKSEDEKVAEVAAFEAAALVTKKEVIKKIKALIKKYENARSDKTADKYKAQIYEELEKHAIKREEVGLKPLKKTATGVMTRESAIVEIQSMIVRYERTRSDSVAAKLKKQINDTMKKFGIQRSEVGLPEKKTTTSKKSIEKKAPEAPKSVMPLKRIPLMPLERAQRGSKTVKIAYLKELWAILNEEKFAGQLKLPRLDLLKSMNIERGRLRGLGVWIGGQRRLAINPNVFNNEGQLYETLLHEMCHQAVSEITKLSYREEKQGHGPVWASWMVKVGLNPKRFDDTDIKEYMTPEQRKEYEAKEDRKNKALEEEVRITPSTGAIAKWFDKHKGIWTAGAIGLPNDKAGKRWAFASPNDPPGRWMVIPANMFYAVDPITERMIRSRLGNRLNELIDSQNRNAAIKKQRREDRKALKDVWGSY